MTPSVLPGILRLPGLFALLLFMPLLPAAEIRIHEGTNITADIHPGDGRVVMALLDSLWLLPPRGGDARRLSPIEDPAARPRWSPDGRRILFQQENSDGSQIRIIPAEGGDARTLTAPGHREQMADWHPTGQRIVYSAPGRDNDLDLWERDLATGLRWRLTRQEGDETDAAWSADGRHLAYIRNDADHWYLMLKPFAQPARVLETSTQPLYVPAWRPDGTLLTYLASAADNKLELRMAILSEPPLTRTLVANEDFVISPVSWNDRQRMLYTADGVIKTRGFEDRRSAQLRFSAAIGAPHSRVGLRARSKLPADTLPTGELLVQASRLFDGTTATYQHDVNVLIRDGRIVSVGKDASTTDGIVVDIGDVTVMPGLIDVFAGLPGDLTPALATRLLASGVTTIVSPDPDTGEEWLDAHSPAPRLLQVATPADKPADVPNAGLLRLVAGEPPNRRQQSALENWRRHGIPLMADNWRSGLAAGADLTLGSNEMPASPQGHRYQDLQLMMQGGPLTLVSALADANTPGLRSLSQETLAPFSRRPVRTPVRANSQTRIVLGSRPSRLPPGIATQAELLALHAAGLAPAAVLRAATSDAADALGLGDEIGRIVPGARADLLLIAGDPLADIVDAAAVVGVIRDGRFYSIGGLLDRLPAVD